MTGTLREDLHTFLIKSRSILRMRNVLQKKSKHTFYVRQLFSENRAVYEITCKNTVEPDMPQMTIQHGARALHDG